MSTIKEQFIQGYWTGYDAEENNLQKIHLRRRQWRNCGFHRGVDDAHSKISPRVEWAWSDCIANLRNLGREEEKLRCDMEDDEAPTRDNDVAK